jgi:hypothetical protein
MTPPWLLLLRLLLLPPPPPPRPLELLRVPLDRLFLAINVLLPNDFALEPVKRLSAFTVRCSTESSGEEWRNVGEWLATLRPSRAAPTSSRR